MSSDLTDTSSTPVSSVTIQPRVRFETVTTNPEDSGVAVSSSGILEPARIRFIQRNSCSRRNFAVNLVRNIFDEDTRKLSNVAGKLGKLKMNPVLMDYVKSLTFQYYPLEPFEREKKEWSNCVLAIDESNRRLNNKPKKLVMS